jgi:phosphoglycerate dehydrogenase-like enzyme
MGKRAVNIAILDDYQLIAHELADWTSLGANIDVQFFATPARDEIELVRRLAPFDVVVAMRERTRFPASLIERLPRLRLLVSTGMRNAAIDVDACRSRGIVVSGARGSNGLAATAETAWALILALEKRLVASHVSLREGRWQPYLAQGVHGKVLGLVGLGHIGRRVAVIGRAFGMDVVAWSPNLSAERAADVAVRRVDKSELFAIADVVSLHLVLSERTAGVVARAELDAMKADAFLINTARAGLVEEAALVDVLRQRRIGGAGLDVFWHEPLPQDHPLCSLDNVVLTPHLGYATRENLAAFFDAALDNIKAWLDGREPVPLET